MRGKLAKAIRRAVGFHPADERRYKLINAFQWWPGVVMGTSVAVGARQAYQAAKRFNIRPIQSRRSV